LGVASLLPPRRQRAARRYRLPSGVFWLPAAWRRLRMARWRARPPYLWAFVETGMNLPAFGCCTDLPCQHVAPHNMPRNDSEQRTRMARAWKAPADTPCSPHGRWAERLRLQTCGGGLACWCALAAPRTPHDTGRCYPTGAGTGRWFERRSVPDMTAGHAHFSHEQAAHARPAPLPRFLTFTLRADHHTPAPRAVPARPTTTATLPDLPTCPPPPTTFFPAFPHGPTPAPARTVPRWQRG